MIMINKYRMKSIWDKGNISSLDEKSGSELEVWIRSLVRGLD